MEGKKLISLVIPLYEEEEVLPHLYTRISSLKIPNYDFEVILVIDPGKDRTFEIAKDICMKDKRWKAILLSKKTSQDYAIDVGLKHAKGDAAIVMDGDLQDPPELIPSMIAKWEKGDLVVSAVRSSRKGESLLKILTSYVFNRIFKFLLRVDVTLDSGNFKLLDRKIIDAYVSIRGNDKYFRAVDMLTSFRSVVTFERPERRIGKTKYGFLNSLGLAINAALFSSAMFLRFTVVLSVIFAMLSIVYSIFILYVYFTKSTVEGWASTNFFISVFACMQFYVLSIIGEFIYRDTIILRNKDTVPVKEKVNL